MQDEGSKQEAAEKEARISFLFGPEEEGPHQ